MDQHGKASARNDMKILVAEKVSEWCLEQLRGLGCQVSYQPELKADELVRHVGGMGVLVVRGKRVSAETLAAGGTLQLVIRAGAGVNTIAVERASEQGIFVSNCPGKNARAVAELTFGLILALDRRIVDNTLELRNGRWNKTEFSKARGLAGRSIGIIGMGQIGELVAARAQAFEMNVVAWSRSLTPERAEARGWEFRGTARDVARGTDIVTLHVADTPETRHLVDADFLARMKRGAYLINTARGGVVDEKALAQAIPERALRVGLDVFEDEPSAGECAYRSALLSLPGVIGTHHIGASTDQAQDAIAEEVVRIVRHFMTTGEVLNCVNLADRSPGKWQLMVRHLDRVGVLAGILEPIRRDGINAQEIVNRVFRGAKAACCAIMLDDRPDDATMMEIRAHPDVIQAELRAVV